MLFHGVGTAFGQAPLGGATVLDAGKAAATGSPSRSGSPGSIMLGPLKLTPTLDLARGYDSNVYFRETNAVSSSYTVVSPQLKLESGPGQLRFDVTLRIDDARYDKTPADNYSNYGLTASGEITFSSRAALRLRAEHRHGSDPRGFTDRATSATPDEWDNTGMEGLFRYGAAGAQGRIEIDAASYARRYTNNRQTTAAADRDTSQLGGAFYWRVRPKTELLVQAQYRRIDYTLSTSTLDSTEERYYVGVKWEATAATTGTAKFGQLRKTFDSNARQNLSAGSWDVGIRWSPRTYSVFDLLTSKQTGESSGVGDAIVTSNYQLVWNHAWSTRFRTQGLAGYRNDAFSGGGVSRLDHVTTLGARATYDFRRWLRLGVEFTRTDRDSNSPGSDYGRNLLLFTVGGTL